MCFNQEMSFGFSALGLFFSWLVYSKTGNMKLTYGIFFFFTMEFLQGLQYFVIDDCGTGLKADINRVLTVLGFLHICLQPYFTHMLNSALVKRDKTRHQFEAVSKLCLIGGGLLFSRWILSPWYSTMNINPEGPCGGSTEWLRGEKLCTFSGKYHLAWSVPMADPTYNLPGAGIHSFLMFAPFFIMRRENWIQGAILYLSGPFLAAYITPNLMEQASIWCFFSILQIGVMLFLIRKKIMEDKKTSTNGNGKTVSESISNGKTPKKDN